MWRKLTLALVVVPLGVVLVALAVVNRKPVELILDPFGGAEPSFSLQAPLFLLLLGAFAVGLIAGGIATWLGQGKWRRSAREEAREARRMAPPGRPAGEGARGPRATAVARG